MARGESSLDAVMAGLVRDTGGKYGSTAMQALNPVWYAQSKIQRREYDAALEICTALLERNPYDQVRHRARPHRPACCWKPGFQLTGEGCVQAVWYLKCRALTLKNWIDDTEIEEEGVAEMLMDDNAIAQCPRPGTSLARPMTSVRHALHPSALAAALHHPVYTARAQGATAVGVDHRLSEGSARRIAAPSRVIELTTLRTRPPQ
jgi:hypothetical protein